jgi:hypothetical protein
MFGLTEIVVIDVNFWWGIGLGYDKEIDTEYVGGSFCRNETHHITFLFLRISYWKDKI